MTLVVKTRDEWRDFWLQCYANRNPDADIGPNSYPWSRACALADSLAIQSNNALVLGNQIPLSGMTYDQMVLKHGDELPPILSTRASGWVTLEAGSAGSTIQNGDRLTHDATKNLYEHTGATALYVNGQQVPVRSVDPGPGQNLEPDTVLNWSVQRPGCYATCRVFSTTEGKGIFGGRDAESSEEYAERIREFKANPVGHGNEGDLLVLAQEASPAHGRPGHGVPVQKAFVYPAISGPGTIGLSFLVKRDNYWESRVPTAGELTAVYNYVVQYMPSEDMIFIAAVLTDATSLDLSVTLTGGASQWADLVPWPTYTARAGGHKVVTSSTSATDFAVGTDDGDYTGEVAPQVGNTVGVFDAANGIFRRKKVATVIGTGPWQLTCDTAANASDTTFMPTVGGSVSPWFDSINDVASVVGGKFALLGLGEMAAADPGDGKRMMRIPRPSHVEWPESVTVRIATDVTTVPSVADASFLSVSPVSPTVGSTAAVYLIRLSDLAVFKR